MNVVKSKKGVQWSCSDERLAEIVSQSTTVSDVCRAMGISVIGHNHRNVRDRVKALGLDTSHFVRYIGNKIPRRPLSELLVENSGCGSSKGRLKKRLIEAGLLTNECGECGQGPVWNGKPITLALDHINGIHSDDRLENLRVVCPNCHSQTSTYCGRNKRV